MIFLPSLKTPFPSDSRGRSRRWSCFHVYIHRRPFCSNGVMLFYYSKISRSSAVLALCVCSVIAACSPSIAPYSFHAYQQAVELKVNSLDPMQLAELPFSEQVKSVKDLRSRLSKAYEFARGRPRNDHSTKQWEIMIDPEAHLLGGFLTRWEEQGHLSQSFITEAQSIVSGGFDAIIGLESGKIGSKQGGGS